jgi:hypothetical protein
MRQTLLVSVAALALTAASATGSFAQKQEGGPGASGMSAPAGTNAPSANPSGATGPSTGTPGAAQHEPSERPAPNAPGTKKGAQDRTIPEKQKSTEQAPSKGDREQKSSQQAPSKSEQPRQQQGQTEQRTNTRQGENANGAKQGGAQTKTGERPMTSKNVSLTTEQKTTIRTKVLTSSAPRITNVDFDIRVGTVVPRTVRIAPVPVTLVEIEPEWRGFMYVVYREEIIIIDPHSLEIVAVLEV